MVNQIQYNYYNIVATKIGDDVFIFRGNRNSPNLVLQNTDSYVASKLTIFSNVSIIEIEHEPITNYNKRVIVRFPLDLYIDIDLGASKEININSIVPKHIQFDIDNTGDIIKLNPIDSVEGFCSKKDKGKLTKEIDKAIDSKLKQHLADVTHCDCSSSKSRGGASRSSRRNDQKNASRKSNLIVRNIEGFKEGATDENTSSCEAIEETKDESVYVVQANPGTEKTIYHEALIGVIFFVVGFYGADILVSTMYRALVNYNVTDITDTRGKKFIDRVDFVLVILATIGIILSVVSLVNFLAEKKSVATTIVTSIFMGFFFITWFVFKTRNKMWTENAAQLNDHMIWVRENFSSFTSFLNR